MFQNSRTPLIALVLSTAVGRTVIPALASSVLDDIGVTSLRMARPTLTGAGVIVALPESSSIIGGVNQNDFQLDPAAVPTTAPVTYVASDGSVIPFSAAKASAHATLVARPFFGANTGPSPGVAAVYNYDANYFVKNVIFANASIPAKVVNQSFVYSPTNAADAPTSEQLYDNYVVNHNTVILSAVGNSSQVGLPASAFNVIGVGAYGGSSAVGPFAGRSKPDITAPGASTSVSAPLVAGVATLLVQAGNESAGGPGTASAATDARTIKAILLNGATKPATWTHGNAQPLDYRFGAGIVHALNAYDILAGGKNLPTLSTTNPLNQAHTPIVSGNVISSQGWNLQTLTSSSTLDAVDHYRISLTGSSLFTLTGTLAWWRPAVNQLPLAGINNLDFFLYDAASNALVASSVSSADNVEHLASLVLTPGNYDLQIVKHGGGSGSANWMSDAETYAVAWKSAAVGNAGATLISPNGYLEFSRSTTINSGISANAVQVNSGTTLVSNSVTAGSLTVSGTHQLQLNGGTSALSTLALAGTSNAWTATLDLTNTQLILHAGAVNKAGVLVVLSNQIASASNNGAWNGNGITSSTAAADPTRKTVVAIDNAVAGLTAFGGIPVDSNDILLEATFKGDTNLDQKVDVADLGTLATFYGQNVSKGRTVGDFNGDGVVNVTDLGVLATTYGLGTPGGFSLESDLAQFPQLSLAQVPEPVSVAFFSLGIIVPLASRRRGRFSDAIGHKSRCALAFQGLRVIV